VMYYTYRELSWRSRLSRRIRDGMWWKTSRSKSDLFIVGTEERAQMIMEFVLVDVLPDHTSFRTGNAVTFFVKDYQRRYSGSDHPEAPPISYTSSKGSTSNRPKRLSTVMLTDNYGMVTKGWVECARTYSFPCWRKRGLRHQRTESSNTLKDFSLISVDFKPVSENGSTCSVARWPSPRTWSILYKIVSNRRTPSRRDTTNARTSMDGTPIWRLLRWHACRVFSWNPA
jgi:hypothetical protein